MSIMRIHGAMLGAGIILLLVVGIRFGVQFRNRIFNLSSHEVAEMLHGLPSECVRMTDCSLEPGDVLLRRYLTPHTRFIATVLNLHFTHAAVYLGEGRLVEAVGTEPNPADDIRITVLSESDWYDAGISEFVILRPRYPHDALQTVVANLQTVAEDPKYRFGISRPGNKQTTCADLVYEALRAGNVLSPADGQAVITPDYLFWSALRTPDAVSVVGHILQKPSQE